MLGEGHIVEQFNRRNVDAFGKVYSTLYERLHYFAAAVCRGSDLSPDDVIHDVFIRIWARRGVQFTSLHGIMVYMFTSIRNNFYNHATHKHHETEYRRRIVLDDDMFVVQMVDGGLRIWLNQAIDTLPEECADVLRYHLEGWRVHEIAERMNISERTVHSRKTEAIDLLRSQFDKNALTFIMLFIGGLE